MANEIPHQSNPTKARWDSRERQEVVARAPYNFVPLPNSDQVVTAQNSLSHDQYHDEAHSGWIDCDLVTESPTYIRGMLTEKVWLEHRETQSKGERLSVVQKEQAAPFFKIKERPVIPGSSLRGMVRQLVEIAGYGRVRWVGDSPTFTYRAVAAPRDDPLRDPYQEALGRFGANVRAGYLVSKWQGGEEKWFVRSAPTSRLINPTGRREEQYLKVKERHIGARDIPGFIRLNSSDYKPQLHYVSFNAEPRRDARGNEHIAVTSIGTRDQGYKYQGVLVCTGNMMETGSGQQRSPRKNHALVIEGSAGREVEIPPQVVDDYRNGITPFVRDEVAPAWGNHEGKAKENGALSDGSPIFYIEADGKVLAFGHAPNFRVASQIQVNGDTRAGNPRDFVPEALRTGAEPDLADAIFGWVEEKGRGGKWEWGPQKPARAGRISFGDAYFVAGEYSEQTITPHILSTPKPTTFQHYLVQDREEGHDPDNKSTLAHYGTPTDETTIRGHKHYWHKGDSPDNKATAKERKLESQLTRIQPLAPGVSFRFRIHFENLRDEELGVLLWALALPGESGAEYRHKIGMGKPLGMGAVQIVPHLTLTNRKERYRSLFAGEGWEQAEQVETDMTTYVAAFERYVITEAKLSVRALHEVPRIRSLLTMLAWPGPDPALTRYMEIEREPGKVNEYKERPVLPGPQVVGDNRLLATLNPASDVRERTGQPSSSQTQIGAQSARSVPQKRGSTLPEVGSTFTNTVLDADETAVLVEIPGFPPEKAIGLIRAENLGGKQYQPDAKARVEVLGISEPQESGRQIVELKPSAKRGKK